MGSESDIGSNCDAREMKVTCSERDMESVKVMCEMKVMF